jgi:synaptobrevin family protein YKT6
MPKSLTCVSIFRRYGADAVLLCMTEDLKDVTFLMRGKAREILLFGTRTIASRISPSQRLSVPYNDVMCHALCLPSGLCATAVTTPDYPSKAAIAVCAHCLQAFEAQYPTWKTHTADATPQLPCPAITAALARFQDPGEADKTIAIQRQLDATKEVMVRNIDALLERGGRIEDLIAQSSDLSMAAKGFATQAARTKRCCSVM